MFATPNESGVCFAMPWWSTSQGESPSFDSSWQTIASAKRNSPRTEERGPAGDETAAYAGRQRASVLR